MHFWQKSHRSGTVFFSMNRIRKCMMLIVPSLMMLTLIIWLRWCLPGFCPVKLPFFFLYWVSYLMEGYCEAIILLFFKLSPMSFIILWWFLPESIIIMMVTKWLFSNSIISSTLIRMFFDYKEELSNGGLLEFRKCFFSPKELSSCSWMSAFYNCCLLNSRLSYEAFVLGCTHLLSEAMTTLRLWVKSHRVTRMISA